METNIVITKVGLDYYFQKYGDLKMQEGIINLIQTFDSVYCPYGAGFNIFA